jgi:hypothetical protein
MTASQGAVCADPRPAMEQRPMQHVSPAMQEDDAPIRICPQRESQKAHADGTPRV